MTSCVILGIPKLFKLHTTAVTRPLWPRYTLPELGEQNAEHGMHGVTRLTSRTAAFDSSGCDRSATGKAPAAQEKLEVLDVAWDDSTGVEQLDRLLIEHFAAEFRQKHKKDVLSNPRALAKLKRQVSCCWAATLLRLLFGLVSRSDRLRSDWMRSNHISQPGSA